MKSSEGNSKDQLEDLEALIAAKDNERRQTQKTIDNLIATVAEAPGEGTKRVLLAKIEALTTALEPIEQEWARLKQDRRNVAKNVVDCEDAFQLLRIFNQEFHKRAAHEQHEVLKDVIRRIVVKEDGLTAEYYASPREDVFPVGPYDFLDDELGAKKEPLPEHRRAAVRSLSVLVESPRLVWFQLLVNNFWLA